MSPTIIAQFFGGLAILSSIIIYSRKKRNSLLLFKAIQDIFWAIHYLLLSCHSAAASSFICVSRSIVFYNSDKKLGKSRLWVALYIVFYIVSSVITWQNFYSILPSLACHNHFPYVIQASKFYEILSSLCTFTFVDTTANKIAEFINQNYRNIISIDILCKEFSFSKNHIINIFKKDFGQTPISYLNTIRISKAEELLITTSDSIESISYDCGYRNYSHFYRQFINKNMISPEEFRKRKRLGE